MHYNERLFGSNAIRSHLHLARFKWLKNKLNDLVNGPVSILELGCFDGRSLDAISESVGYYEGFDANWEGGLDLAREKWKGVDQFHFYNCLNAIDFAPRKEIFDLSVCLETLEHLPLDQLDDFIHTLYEKTKSYCLVTIPNEHGIVFLLKYLFKRIIWGIKHPHYTKSEIWNATMGRCYKVKRLEKQHKGFDYREMIRSLSKKFSIVKTESIPIGILPKSLSFTIGLIMVPVSNLNDVSIYEK